MSPLVFALLFVVVECLTLFFVGCFGYARLRTRLEELEPRTPDHAAIGEAVTQLIDAHHWLLDQRAKAADPAIQARTFKAITALREFAGRLAAGERISPAHCRQLTQLCCEMARTGREETLQPAETAAAGPQAPAETAPAEPPPQN